jgi:pyruvate formate lyase activating enzyme
MDCSVIRVTPEEILQKCLKNNIRHVAFTYAEPFTWYEFIYDTAKLLHKNAISVVLVTNGFVKREPFQLILPYISAMNIDLKSFSDHFYKTFCSGQLTPVLETIKTAVGKCHVEITLLLIETLNDDLWELDHIFKFLHDLSPDIPLHISKYFPRYKMMLPETSLDSLQNHIKRAKTFLKYVYAGNILHSDYLNTYCPQCNDMLIMRSTGSISISNLNNGICANCEEKIPLVVYF